jgi:hypothetical protein
MGRRKDFESQDYIKDCIKRFYEKIRVDENGCWLWIGCTNEKYGCLRFKNTNIYAHRFCFEYIRKEKIGDKFVCHTCDRPLCVNPDHLFLGTHNDNMTDATSKRRHAYGEKHYQKKIREDDIKEICKLVKCGLSQTEISKIFDIEQTNISAIVLEKNWKYSDREKYDIDILIRCMIMIFGELKTYQLLSLYEKIKE